MIFMVGGILKSALHELQQRVDCLSLWLVGKLGLKLLYNVAAQRRHDNRLGIIAYRHLRIFIQYRIELGIGIAMDFKAAKTYTERVLLVRDF